MDNGGCPSSSHLEAKQLGFSPQVPGAPWAAVPHWSLAGFDDPIEL